MKKRGSAEFFELFRRPDEDESKSSPGVLRRESAATTRSSASSGRIVLAVKYETAVLIGFVVVAVLVASHVLAYYRGKSRREQIEGRPAAASSIGEMSEYPATTSSGESRTPDTATPRHAPTAAAVQAPFRSLQVMTAPLSNVRRVRDDLVAMGYDAFICRPAGGQDYTIHVGRFATLSEAKASGLQETFKAMQYHGQRPFTSCYYVQIRDGGRIVP